MSRGSKSLLLADLFAARREGKWMHYRICAPAGGAVDSILAAVLAALGRDQQMRADRAKLDPACCVPQKQSVPR
jgi:ArsR family transcriptional regulator